MRNQEWREVRESVCQIQGSSAHLLWSQFWHQLEESVRVGSSQHPLFWSLKDFQLCPQPMQPDFFWPHHSSLFFLVAFPPLSTLLHNFILLASISCSTSLFGSSALSLTGTAWWPEESWRPALTREGPWGKMVTDASILVMFFNTP